jgi:hypothetical protein
MVNHISLLTGLFMIGADKGTLAFAIRRVNGGQTILDKLTGAYAVTV